MQTLISPEDTQLQIRIDTRDATAVIHYLHGQGPRWRTTPLRTADYLRDPQTTLAQVYDFFDSQWRGC